ncbi:MAG: transposase, partial [Armatimonadetes bacterium]|nr:transposase [Armatimonadota bacterium]
MVKRRKFVPEFKAKVVLEVLSGTRSAAAACRECGLKPDL